MRASHGLVAALVALAVTGCGTNRPEIPPELLAPVDGGGDYPPGPYGAQPGNTFPALSFLGWRNPRAAGYAADRLETISVADFWDPDGARGIELVLVNSAALWCTACRIEHAELPGRYAVLEPRGVRILSGVLQGSSLGAAATLRDVTVWAETFESNYPLVLDADQRLQVLGPVAAAPHNAVLDAGTLRVLALYQGNTPDLWSFLERELAARGR